MDIQLSKKADMLICLIYKKYKNDIKSGISLDKAKILGGSNKIQETIAPKLSPEDVDSLCRELGRYSLLKNMYADDIVYFTTLSDSAIVYMENRFKNNFKELLEYIEKFKSLIM